MNKKEFIYVSPTVAVKEMYVEGVLCGSPMGAELSVAAWDDNTDFSWN